MLVLGLLYAMNPVGFGFANEINFTPGALAVKAQRLDFEGPEREKCTAGVARVAEFCEGAAGFLKA